MDREQRIRRLCPQLIGSTENLDSSRRYHAIVCSRLGRDLARRRRTFDYLQQAVLKAKGDGATLLVVAGTAPEPWVRRAAELFQVTVGEIRLSDPQHRDAALVAVAEKVFAIWARRGGKIADLLSQRAEAFQDESTWVAVNEDPECASATLLGRGAVGWYLKDANADLAARADVPAVPTAGLPTALTAQQVDWSQYLVHCTRGRSGPLPGQSPGQYRDEVLLGGDGGRPATAEETLQKILRDGWLCAAARVSSHQRPVVCWSQVPLPELLARRTFRAHLGRWDYEPYGIAVHRSAAARLRIQPVIYGDRTVRQQLPAEEQWRFQAVGKSVDWRREQEWRSAASVDLSQLGPEEALVFVGAADCRAGRAALGRWPVVVVDTFL